MLNADVDFVNYALQSVCFKIKSKNANIQLTDIAEECIHFYITNITKLCMMSYADTLADTKY